ncbi:DNA repair protein complementing XP-C cells homolog isoform X2 [Acropora palmata]|uniref:DNA repair protein complementing XP-C cells homolog isoform X2 n=1 Tax=Acropora palmata TaxID=6131 RepID=UPI003DA16540
MKRKSRSLSKLDVSEAMQHGLKSTLKSTSISSKRSKGNFEDTKKEASERPSRNSKKRNLSVNESTSVPIKKKAKVDSSQARNEKSKLATEAKNRGSRSLQKITKKQSSSTESKQKKADTDVLTKSVVKQQMIKEEVKQENSIEDKNKSPFKYSNEKLPQNLVVSPRKEKNVKKRLDLDSAQGTAQPCAIKQEVESTLSEDSDSDNEGVAWEDVDEAHVADHLLETLDKSDSSAANSYPHQSPSKKNVEISITMPGSKKKKKGWDQEEIMKCVKRAVNRFKKETIVNVHKVHLLTLVAHGIFRNGICNDQLLQAYFLSHVPGNFLSGNKRKWDVAQLTSFLQWFQNKFSSVEEVRTGDQQGEKKIAVVGNLSEILVALLRGLGLLVRLVYSLQPISIKGDVESKASKKTQKQKTPKACKENERKCERISKTPTSSKKANINRNDNTKSEIIGEGKREALANSTVKVGVKGKSESKALCATPGRTSGESSTEQRQDEKQSGKKLRESMKSQREEKCSRKRNNFCAKDSVGSSSDSSVVKKREKGKRPLRKRKKIDYSLCDDENEKVEKDEQWNGLSSSSESEECEETSQGKDSEKKRSKASLVRKEKMTESDSAMPTGSNTISFVELLDDDSDFEVSSKPLRRKPLSARIGGGKKSKSLKIISSDESSDSIQCMGDLRSEKENAIKDVTNRYASSWMSKTRKLRIDDDWWEETLRPFKSRNKKMNELEDSQLEDKLLEKPLPTSITEFKNHPLYVLKRHLLKFEAIYPETAAILGYCRGEAIYSRDCVHLLHTREKWLNEALVVKQGEKAYKVVKGRPKRNQPIHERDSVTIDLFGRWQTERYKPPPAKDGKVPRNEYGNVELFLPCMLPPGTKHIQINGIQRVAKKLGIDCAQAVVGFDFHCGFSHPVTDGVVVCQEFEQVLLDAWREEEELAERRKAEKREKRMLANWKLLTRSLLIRERLKKRYDTKTEDYNVAETSNISDDEKVTDTSVAWPLNRQEGKSSIASDGHCHVFPESGHKQDCVTGEWTKSCSCGLTLPFERM